MRWQQWTSELQPTGFDGREQTSAALCAGIRWFAQKADLRQEHEAEVCLGHVTGRVMRLGKKRTGPREQ